MRRGRNAYTDSRVRWRDGGGGEETIMAQSVAAVSHGSISFPVLVAYKDVVGGWEGGGDGVVVDVVIVAGRVSGRTF